MTKKPASRSVAQQPPKDFGITLSVNQADITQPSFPVRWKYSDELLRRITEGLAKGYGYGLLIVARDGGDFNYHYEVRSIARVQQYFQLLEVTRPGVWNIGILLFERRRLPDYGADTTRVLMDDLRRGFLSTYKKWEAHVQRVKYDESIRSISDVPVYNPEQSGEYFGIASMSSEMGVVIAKHMVEVEVSPDVFPAPPPAWLAAYGNYFWNGRMPYDQCYFGRRLLIMIPGFVPWFVFEMLKRSILGLTAVVMFLTCRQNWWKFGDAALEPAVNVELFTLYEAEIVTTPIDLYKQPWTAFVTPLSLLAMSVPMVALYSLSSDPSVQQAFQAVSGGASSLARSGTTHLVLLGTGVLLLAYLGRKWLLAATEGLWHDLLVPAAEGLMDRLDKYDTVRRAEGLQATVERAKSDAATLRHFEELLTTDAPVEVRVDAVPKPLRPRGFNWLSLFKRSHCSPYGA